MAIREAAAQLAVVTHAANNRRVTLDDGRSVNQRDSVEHARRGKYSKRRAKRDQYRAAVKEAKATAAASRLAARGPLRPRRRCAAAARKRKADEAAKASLAMRDAMRHNRNAGLDERPYTGSDEALQAAERRILEGVTTAPEIIPPWN